MRLGVWEILIVLVIVLLIFGPGRISKVAGEMGKGIKAFKDGLTNEHDQEKQEAEEEEKK